VALRVGLSPEGPVDRLDDLPQRCEQLRAGPLSLALAGGMQQLDAQLRQLRLELAAEAVLVADQCLPRTVVEECRFDGEDVLLQQQDLSAQDVRVGRA